MTIRGKKSLRNAFFRALGPNAASTASETPPDQPRHRFRGFMQAQRAGIK